jgi:hypothetical protein
MISATSSTPSIEHETYKEFLFHVCKSPMSVFLILRKHSHVIPFWRKHSLRENTWQFLHLGFWKQCKYYNIAGKCLWVLNIISDLCFSLDGPRAFCFHVIWMLYVWCVHCVCACVCILHNLLMSVSISRVNVIMTTFACSSAFIKMGFLEKGC